MERCSVTPMGGHPHFNPPQSPPGADGDKERWPQAPFTSKGVAQDPRAAFPPASSPGKEQIGEFPRDLGVSFLHSNFYFPTKQ